MVVWLVIASFHNDEDVMRILDEVHGCGHKVVDKVLVIDSEGTQTIPKLIIDQGWQDVIYKSYDENLGSGANLCERLRIAAEGGADYAYALNHDGHFDEGVLAALIEAAADLGDLGAVYPLGYLSLAAAYNLTGTRELPRPAKLVHLRPRKRMLDAFWSSSNGALYSMEPVRRGILPWGAMWMSWEDLEYGWRLSSNGYRQVIVCDAVYVDSYEYRKTWLGRTVDKQAWRTYYFSRNLLMAIRRNRNQAIYYAVASYRFFRELCLIWLVRDCKWERTRFLLEGIIDGLCVDLGCLHEAKYGEPPRKQTSPRSVES